jgi:hypothetical protein
MPAAVAVLFYPISVFPTSMLASSSSSPKIEAIEEELSSISSSPAPAIVGGSFSTS